MSFLSKTGVDFFWSLPLSQLFQWEEAIGDVSNTIAEIRNGK